MNKSALKSKTVKKCAYKRGEASYGYTLSEHLCSDSKSYSIEVRLSLNGQKPSSATTGPVFCEMQRALSFYEKLRRNLATPIDLSYVFEDEF